MEPAARRSHGLLPPTRHLSLTITVALLAAGSLALAAFSAVEVVRKPSVINGCMTAAWLLLAVGIWRLNRAARWVAIVLLWFVILLFTVGFLNPESVGHAIRHPEAAWPTWVLVTRAVVAAIVCVAMLHILGKYKGDFGRRKAVEPPVDHETATSP
jgi:phosphatidylserine synthase